MFTNMSVLIFTNMYSPIFTNVYVLIFINMCAYSCRLRRIVITLPFTFFLGTGPKSRLSMAADR